MFDVSFEYLQESNLEQYIEYLRMAFEQSPLEMTAERVDEEGLRERIRSPFFNNTKSILAIKDGAVIGRIEFHFYGCFQDGYKMAYVDWVYVLPNLRKKGVARQLFHQFESVCRKNQINQYYLIRTTNDASKKFYESFRDVQLTEEAFLRKFL